MPAPLRDADLLDPQTWTISRIGLACCSDQALPGIVATVLLTQIALVATAFWPWPFSR